MEHVMSETLNQKYKSNLSPFHSFISPFPFSNSKMQVFPEQNKWKIFLFLIFFFSFKCQCQEISRILFELIKEENELKWDRRGEEIPFQTKYQTRLCDVFNVTKFQLQSGVLKCSEKFSSISFFFLKRREGAEDFFKAFLAFSLSQSFTQNDERFCNQVRRWQWNHLLRHRSIHQPKEHKSTELNLSPSILGWFNLPTRVSKRGNLDFFPASLFSLPKKIRKAHSVIWAKDLGFQRKMILNRIYDSEEGLNDARLIHLTDISISEDILITWRI